MKMIWLILLWIGVLHASSFEMRQMGQYDVVILHKSYDIYDSKGAYIQLYREAPNKDLIFLLRLTLNDISGGCAKRSIEEGAYEIEENNITLYSQWRRQGKAYDAPFGARIQRYILENNGTLRRLSSQIYIEAEKRHHDPESGMEYLFIPPQTPAEQSKLHHYITNMEQRYHGTFVMGKVAKNLIQKVNDALQEKVKKRWKKGSRQ